MNNSSVTQSRVQTASFYVNDYKVDPSQNQLLIEGNVVNVQPKVMEVLCYLSSHSGQLVTTDELISACWDSRLINDSPVHKCIAQLRRSLRDNPKQPRFIKTVVKKGYVLIGDVRGLAKQSMPLSLWDKGNPYPGEKAYSLIHESVFFGRSVYIEDVIRWFSNLNETKQAWLSVEGVARLGKTSMIQAGILPNLKHCRLFHSCASDDVIAIDFKALESDTSKKDKLLNCLKRSPQIKALFETNSIGSRVKTTPRKRVAVILDHLEVILKDVDALEICQILEVLLRSNLCVLITGVDSKYAPVLSELMQDFSFAHHCELKPPSANEFIAITRLPFIKNNMTFEFDEYRRESLDNVITQNLQLNPIPLHVLQLFLSDLYAKSSTNVVLFSDYEALGGLPGYYADLIEQNFELLSNEEKVQFGELLYSLIDMESDGELEIKVIRHSHLTPDHNQYEALIDKCIRIGIINETFESSERFIFLAHDYLIDFWNRIHEWKQIHLTNLYLIHDFRIFANRWATNQKQSQYLIPSRKKLSQVQRLVSEHRVLPNAYERDFLSQSALKLRKKHAVLNSVKGILFAGVVSLLALTYQLNSKNTELDVTRSSAEDLISFILYDLKAKLEPLGKLELLDIAAQRTLGYFHQEDPKSLQGENLYRWITALHILGEVNIGKHRYEKAIALFEETKSVLESKTDLQSSEKELELYMLSNYWIGYIHFITDEYSLAEAYLVDYSRIAHLLSETFPDDVWLLENSYALNNLGALAEKQNRLHDASRYFDESLALKLRLLKQVPDDLDLLHDTADTLSWQSSILAQLGQLKKSIQLSLEALALIENSDTPQDSITQLEYTADIYHNLARRYFEGGALAEALAHVEEALERRKTLTLHDEQNAAYAFDLVWSYLLHTKLLIRTGDYDKSLVLVSTTNDMLEELVNGQSNPKSVTHANAWSMFLNSQILFKLNQHQTASSLLSKSKALFNSALEPREYPFLWSRILLGEVIYNNTTMSAISATNKQELLDLKQQLSALIDRNAEDYEAIFFYLIANKFLGEDEYTKEYSLRYKQSDYETFEFLNVNINL